MPRDEKFILLAYGDHADHDGGNVYPSVALIARKTGYSERSVQSISRKLEREGRLVLDGKGPKGTKKWRIPIAVGGAISAPRGVQKTAPGGADCDTGGAIAAAPEPSLEPSRNRGRPQKPRPRDLLFDAIAEVCEVDPKTAGSSIGKVKTALEKGGYTPEEVRAFGAWWWADKFRAQRKTPPRVWQLQEQIGVIRQLGPQSDLDGSKAFKRQLDQMAKDAGYG